MRYEMKNDHLQNPNSLVNKKQLNLSIWGKTNDKPCKQSVIKSRNLRKYLPKGLGKQHFIKQAFC